VSSPGRAADELLEKLTVFIGRDAKEKARYACIGKDCAKT
jgi:hypothetical protein